MRGDGIKTFLFDTYEEFIDYADRNRNHISGARYTDGWAGRDAVTYDAALNLARKGWESGRTKIRSLVDKLNIAGHVHRQTIQFDVTGDCWDMGRVVSGVPECAMNWEVTEDVNEHGKIIEMIVNTTVSGGIDESLIRTRGAAILAMIEGLETVGYRVGITMLFCESSGFHVEIRVKNPDEQMQDDLIAFAVAHPSFSRRFGHAVTGRGILPGNPNEIEKQCDIYIPMMGLWEPQWMTEKSTIDWIKEYLSKYGVKYE